MLGHSCNSIDEPYFRQVLKSISISANWLFSWHTDDDIQRIDKLCQTIGIDINNRVFVHI